jgi:hypothetical protein
VTTAIELLAFAVAISLWVNALLSLLGRYNAFATLMRAAAALLAIYGAALIRGLLG